MSASNENENLVERYIYAATKDISRKYRNEIAAEMRVLISDMLEERCGELSPKEVDIRVVLTELGTPEETRSKYDPSGEKYLIGPRYFPKFISMMKRVLFAIALGVSVVFLLKGLSLIGSGTTMFELLLSYLVTLGQSLLGGVLAVTATFAIMEYRKVSIYEISGSLDDLPLIPEVPSAIPQWESIAGIVFAVAIAFVLIFLNKWIVVPINEYSNFPNGWHTYGNVLNEITMKIIRPWMLVFAVLGIVKHSVRFVSKRYDLRVLISTWVCGIAAAGIAILALDTPNLFTTNVIYAFFGQIFGFNEGMAYFDMHFALFLSMFIAAILALDIGVVTYRYFRAREMITVNRRENVENDKV